MTTEQERLAVIFRNLLNKADKAKKEFLLQEFEKYRNPLAQMNLIPDLSDEELLHGFGVIRTDDGKVSLRGGSGTVGGQGQSVDLGGALAGQTINVSVQPQGGVCTITIQAWAPFAQVPYGCWEVGGPGSKQIILGATSGPPIPVGTITTVKAVGTSGTFPAYVVYN